jgi:hypothetical protein
LVTPIRMLDLKENRDVNSLKQQSCHAITVQGFSNTFIIKELASRAGNFNAYNLKEPSCHSHFTIRGLYFPTLKFLFNSTVKIKDLTKSDLSLFYEPLMNLASKNYQIDFVKILWHLMMSHSNGHKYLCTEQLSISFLLKSKTWSMPISAVELKVDTMDVKSTRRGRLNIMPHRGWSFGMSLQLTNKVGTDWDSSIAKR